MRRGSLSRLVRATIAGTCCFAAVTTASGDARANGRFPESNQIVFAENDPDLVMLRVTFGLLVSHDRGHTFDWVCETSIGFSGIEDPMYAVTPSRSYVATTFQGLTVSRDQGCNWSFVEGDLAHQVFIDLTSQPRDRKDIVVFASSYDKQDEQGNILFSSRLWETKDEARTFQQLGDRLDPTLLGYTVDLTPTDPNRLYLTAVRNAGTKPTAILLTSKNRGQTWEEMEVPLINNERSLWVAGVDPNDAERVYLRTAQGAIDRPTRLLLREATEGGAPTLRILHSAPDALLGFALAPDGSKVYVGSPKGGVHVASTSDFVFQQRSSQEVQCLGISADGLWACSNEAAGFVAGLSKDDGATFEPRLHFCDIRGPLACAPGTTTYDRCIAAWAAQRATLGCGPDSSSGGSNDSGAGSTGDAGPATALSARGGGCNNQAAPVGSWSALVASAGVAIALARRLRRRMK